MVLFLKKFAQANHLVGVSWLLVRPGEIAQNLISATSANLICFTLFSLSEIKRGKIESRASLVNIWEDSQDCLP